MGIRVVALATEVFGTLAELTARRLGLPGESVILFPHPLNSRPDDEIAAAGDERLGTIRRRLGLSDA